MTEKSKCPLCGSKDTGFYCKNYQGVDYYSCLECGLHFNLKSIEEFETEYSEENRLFLIRNDRTIVERNRSKEIAKLTTKGAVLDLGCGEGIFLDELSRHGNYDLYGIEPNKSVVSRAKKIFPHINIFNSFFEKAKLGKKMDAIASYHVIEHIKDPNTFLSFCNKKLKKGGFLILETPNVESFDSRRQKGDWWMIKSYHVSLFTPDTMRKALESHGFKIVKINSVGRFFRPEAKKVMASLEQQIVEQKTPWIFSTKNMIARFLLSSVFFAYDLFVKTLRMGESMRVIAVKVKEE